MHGDLVGEPRDGQRLQPDRSGALEYGEEDSVSAEDGILQAWNHHDLEGDRGLECADVAGMDAQDFAGGKVLHDQLAGELDPRRSLAGDLLEQEAVAAKDAGAQRLLEADADGDAVGGAEEAVAVDHVLLAGADGDGDDVARDLGGERDFAGILHGAVFSHEEAAAAGHALEHAEEAAASAHLGVGGHLDRSSHPGELTALGKDALVGIKLHIKYGHSGALDSCLHCDCLPMMDSVPAAAMLKSS